MEQPQLDHVTVFHTTVAANGINLHVAQAGPDDGPLVILLHGFPEFWYGWRRQINALVVAGYRLWIPDQRGYNLSDKPESLDAYTIDELAGDVIGLMDAAGVDDAIVVGHDWGAAVAWWTANKFPRRVRKLAVLNVPHHAVMRRALKGNRKQMQRSWYMFYFQLPWLPEQGLRANNCRGLAGAMKGSARPGLFSREEMAHYRTAWMQPGAITGMLNWYRAIMRKRPARLPSLRIQPPTLLIWGAEDKFLGRELAQPSIDLCDAGRLVFVEGASHWVQHEEAEQVNSLLLDFFAEE